MPKPRTDVMNSRTAFRRAQGSRVRQLMTEAGLNQTQLAQKSKIYESALSAMLNGKRGISPQQLDAIARALEKQVDDLMPEQVGVDAPGIRPMTQPPMSETVVKMVDPVLESFIARNRPSISDTEERVLRGASNSRDRGAIITDAFLLDLLRIIKRHGIGLGGEPPANNHDE